MFDCIVIGGGAAGLTAANYLGRFRRSVSVFDNGGSRMKRIPISRNVPGFPDGIRGEELYARLYLQAKISGAQMVHELVTDLHPDNGNWAVETRTGVFTGRSILLATGVKLVEPEIEDLEAGILDGRVRYCPICDGYEAINRKIAVLAGRPGAIEEAQFLKTYSRDVTLVWSADAVTEVLSLSGVEILEDRVATLRLVDGGVSVTLRGGSSRTFDILYPCLGAEPAHPMIERIGVATHKSGGLLCDGHQRTSVPGIYAAGDLLKGIDQIASAFGQGAIAATAIHNDLRHAR